MLDTGSSSIFVMFFGGSVQPPQRGTIPNDKHEVLTFLEDELDLMRLLHLQR